MSAHRHLWPHQLHRLAKKKTKGRKKPWRDHPNDQKALGKQKNPNASQKRFPVRSKVTHQILRICMPNITKLLGNQWEKKERKGLQDTSTGFKTYPKTSELTQKSNLSRTFYFYKFHFCSILFLYFQRKKLLAGKVKNFVFLSAPCP